ncbi:MAG TPA: beta-ketoacyl synthase N-terminal-like domain-containing protein, partial [Xanthobacteraceae bacterium]|nr:beta-ketoacyl synthase N-terminal-like domain-containing protein [Xanthobacteraceae bacterium]
MNAVNRVAITGAGVVSPVGHSTQDYCAALKKGQSGIGPITIPYAEELYQKVAAEVRDFDPAKHFDARQLAMMDRVSHFAVVAAREAIAQAGIDFGNGLSE